MRTGRLARCRAGGFCIGALIALVLMAGQAKAEWANFIGGGVMHGFSRSCIGWENRPHAFSVRLNIPDLTDPAAPTTVSFLASHYAMSYRLNSGRFGTEFQRVRALTLYGTFENHQARVRLMRPLPDLSSSAPIRLRGEIRDMDGMGCNVQFDATVARGRTPS